MNMKHEKAHQNTWAQIRILEEKYEKTRETTTKI